MSGTRSPLRDDVGRASGVKDWSNNGQIRVKKRKCRSRRVAKNPVNRRNGVKSLVKKAGQNGWSKRLVKKAGKKAGLKDCQAGLKAGQKGWSKRQVKKAGRKG